MGEHVMSEKKPIPILVERNIKICSVCGRRSYSREGVHPQCVMLQADAPGKCCLPPRGKLRPRRDSEHRQNQAKIAGAGRPVTKTSCGCATCTESVRTFPTSLIFRKKASARSMNICECCARWTRPAPLGRSAANMAMSLFSRYCGHPMSGGVKRVWLDGVDDFLSLRRNRTALNLLRCRRVCSCRPRKFHTHHAVNPRVRLRLPGTTDQNDPSLAVLFRGIGRGPNKSRTRTGGTSRSAIAPGAEQIVSPRKDGSKIDSSIDMVLQMVVAEKTEHRAAALKPIRLDIVNSPMHTRPQIRVEKAPRQQRRYGNADRRHGANGEPPQAQQKKGWARQQETISQGDVDHFRGICSLVVRRVGFELAQLRVQQAVGHVHNPAMRAVLQQRDERRQITNHHINTNSQPRGLKGSEAMISGGTMVSLGAWSGVNLNGTISP